MSPAAPPQSATVAIVTYGPSAGGGRRRSFDVDGITVYVEPCENDDRGRLVAERLAVASGEIARLTAENRRLEAQIPPPAPARILGPGCVRERDGQLWLLNNAAHGWSSFGVRVDDWDDLFRRYNARVVSYGHDKDGAFWTVEPGKVSS